MNFSQISSEAFDQLQINAGMVLNKFDVTGTTPVEDADIVCATTGGITASCVPVFSDYGEDIDNCPNNTLELKRIDEYECKLAFTSLSVTAKSIKMSLGATTTEDGKIMPKADLEASDFTDVWWVGDLANGGWVAVKLCNALSSGGFSLKTTKKAKGQLSVELTGHTALANQKKVPMEFYIGQPA